MTKKERRLKKATARYDQAFRLWLKRNTRYRSKQIHPSFLEYRLAGRNFDKAYAACFNIPALQF